MTRRGSTARESGERFALLIRQACFSRGVIGVICITLTTLVTSVATASAQNIIEALFGSLWSSPVSTAAPNATLPSPEAARSEGGVAFLRAPVRRTLLSNSTP
jgi:hypothetical protein